MGNLTVFNHVTLDGYFVDAKGDMRWAHRASDPEWDDFVASNARNPSGALLFGRKTYELMASYWPSPMAKENDPVVAEGMNKAQKVVISSTLKKATWNNTRLLKSDLPAEVRKLKAEFKDGVVVMGSGTLVAQLTQEGLVDVYQVIVNPLVLGAGRTMFEGVKKPVELKLKDSRRFKNGKVLLTYAPA